MKRLIILLLFLNIHAGIKSQFVDDLYSSARSNSMHLISLAVAHATEKDNERLSMRFLKISTVSALGYWLSQKDREFGHEIFKKYGLKTVELKDFHDIEDAVFFIKNNPKNQQIADLY